MAPPDQPDMAEADKEPKPNAKIPKASKPEDEGKSKRTRVQPVVENTDVGSEVDIAGSDITLGRLVNPQEALGYAMTQEDPVSAIRQLAARNQLSDVTDTYALMEDNGFVMGR